MAQSPSEEKHVLESNVVTKETTNTKTSNEVTVHTTVIMILTQCDGHIALRPDPGSSFGSGMIAKLPSKKFDDISNVKEMFNCTLNIFLANDPRNAKFIRNQKIVPKNFRFGSTDFFVFFVETKKQIQNEGLVYFSTGILKHKRPSDKIAFSANHWQIPPTVVKALELFKEELA